MMDRLPTIPRGMKEVRMTSGSGIRLDSMVRIAVFEPLREVNGALLKLLAGFDSDDWQR